MSRWIALGLLLGHGGCSFLYCTPGKHGCDGSVHEFCAESVPFGPTWYEEDCKALGYDRCDADLGCTGCVEGELACRNGSVMRCRADKFEYDHGCGLNISCMSREDGTVGCATYEERVAEAEAGDNPTTLVWLGWDELGMGDPAAAARHGRGAMKLVGRSASRAYGLEVVCYARVMGGDRAGVEDCREAVALDRWRTAASGMVAWTAGDDAAAEAAWASAPETAERPELVARLRAMPR
jgi:hypothetical protein